MKFLKNDLGLSDSSDLTLESILIFDLTLGTTHYCCSTFMIFSVFMDLSLTARGVPRVEAVSMVTRLSSGSQKIEGCFRAFRLKK